MSHRNSSATILEVAAPQCVAEDFDGEIVVLNTDSGVYFSLRGFGASLWADLAAGHSVEALVGLAGDPATAAAVRSFANSLISEGLMRPAPAPVEPSAAPTLDVKMLSGEDPPILEAFHDMKSLLLLDPVHEVDPDVGWPKLPEA
jgi:hypothetical protein